jgi:oxygen-independent coproporphyrinogen III oxidase
MPNERSLAVKYNRPTPRYTSYPTVPFWKEGIEPVKWMEAVARQFREHNVRDGISLYIHLPFCETLCTYCGCNKKITTNHTVEERYIEAILGEWRLYRDQMPALPVIRELHLGGGTPTFFSPENLSLLVTGLLDGAVIPTHANFSLEGHPNNTTAAHLSALYKLGFRRVSYGVQDTNPEVQKIINRIQPFENVRQATETARKTGFDSVNFDLIYGLPRQGPEQLEHTLRESLSLRPDRIAFYSYAHTPWANCGQRLIDERDLPTPEQKLGLYLQGREIFLELGYTDIGMDHFALPTDELYQAWKKGTLHRNFMGYTPQKSSLLIGLGVSAISDAGAALTQNDKTLAGYYRAVESGHIAVKKGYFRNEEDQLFGAHILDISCRNRTEFREADRSLLEEYSLPVLRELEKDGLIRLDEKGVEVTGAGRPFIRNICKAFDLHLLRSEINRVEGEPALRCGRSALGQVPLCAEYGQGSSGEGHGEQGRNKDSRNEGGRKEGEGAIYSNAI